MPIHELHTSLFDGQADHLLAQPMAEWLASSRRFAEFVRTNYTKIRKKIRTVQDRHNLLDLQFELETAYLLLRERSLSLDYEPPHQGHTRRPDFAVTFPTRLTFIVEATRLQPDWSGRVGARLADTVCNKLGQLLPQRSNVLVVGAEAVQLTEAYLRAAMLRLQQRAEKEATFLQKLGFRDRAEFFAQYHRLSEIIVRRPRALGSRKVIAWVNPQAKHPLSSPVRTVLYRSQAG